LDPRSPSALKDRVRFNLFKARAIKSGTDFRYVSLTDNVLILGVRALNGTEPS